MRTSSSLQRRIKGFVGYTAGGVMWVFKRGIWCNKSNTYNRMIEQYKRIRQTACESSTLKLSLKNSIRYVFFQ